MKQGSPLIVRLGPVKLFLIKFKPTLLISFLIDWFLNFYFWQIFHVKSVWALQIRWAGVHEISDQQQDLEEFLEFVAVFHIVARLDARG